MSFQDIWDQIQNDPTTIVEPDVITKWIEDIPEERYHYLENKTLDTIHKEKEQLLMKYKKKQSMLHSLLMYRYVNDLQELSLGRNIRWIKHGKDSLTNGGILVKISFNTKGVYLLVKTFNHIMQLQMDSCIIFQLMSAEECMILMANKCTFNEKTN